MHQFTPGGWSLYFSTNKLIREFARRQWCSGTGNDKNAYANDLGSGLIDQGTKDFSSRVQGSYGSYIRSFPRILLRAVPFYKGFKLDDSKQDVCKLSENGQTIYLKATLNQFGAAIITEKQTYSVVIPGSLTVLFELKPDEGFRLTSIQTNSKLFADMVKGEVDEAREEFYAELTKLVANLEMNHVDSKIIESFTKSFSELYEYHPRLRKRLQQYLFSLRNDCSVFQSTVPMRKQLLESAVSLSRTCQATKNVIHAENAKLLLYQVIDLFPRYGRDSIPAFNCILTEINAFIDDPDEVQLQHLSILSAYFSKRFSWAVRISGHIMAVIGVGILMCAVGLGLFAFSVFPPVTVLTITLTAGAFMQQLAMGGGIAGILFTGFGLLLKHHHHTPVQLIEQMGLKFTS